MLSLYLSFDFSKELINSILLDQAGAGAIQVISLSIFSIFLL
jgi:hypothetical protein